MSFRISDPTRKRPGLRTSPGSSSDLAASPRCLCERPASTIRPLERKAWAPAHSVNRSSHSAPAPRRVPLNFCVSIHTRRTMHCFERWLCYSIVRYSTCPPPKQPNGVPTNSAVVPTPPRLVPPPPLLRRPRPGLRATSPPTRYPLKGGRQAAYLLTYIPSPGLGSVGGLEIRVL
jgi:hypothetical protein